MEPPWLGLVVIVVMHCPGLSSSPSLIALIHAVAGVIVVIVASFGESGRLCVVNSRLSSNPSMEVYWTRRALELLYMESWAMHALYDWVHCPRLHIQQL